MKLFITMEILSGKNLKLVVDGATPSVANTGRARTQEIKRLVGKFFGQTDTGSYTLLYAMVCLLW